MNRWIGIGGIGLFLLGLWLLARPTEPTPFSLPSSFRPLAALPIPEHNPLSEEGVALGRMLFYDPILSADSTISCASCHQPKRAFTDGNALSKGIFERRGRRSAPSLVNVGYVRSGLFWDGRTQSLEAQALHPITDTSEMGHNWSSLLPQLANHAMYGPLFQSAFQRSPNELSPEDVGRALAQFQRTLISRQSKFDRVQRGETQFSESEARGWAIFFDADPTLPDAECNHCHNEPLFTDGTFSNNGLDYAPDPSEFADLGRGAITNKTADAGRFRVPTLRNIALTAPYMHDGRLATLEKVIDHYNSGGHYAVNRSPNVRPLHLTQQDQEDLIAFLHCLTDTVSLQQAAWQNPFE